MKTHLNRGIQIAGFEYFVRSTNTSSKYCMFLY